MRGVAHVLVACSGGPDSQVLLHALHTLREEHGCALTAASVDHGLRTSAAEDVAIASRLAHALGVPFVPLRVSVPSGPSRQAQARAARYEALLACARAHGAERIAVGHTLDDQAETVLARLLRGAGIEGLAAAAPERADGVVRPLIDTPRAAIHRYAAARALEVAHDPSNRDPRFLRVRIRERLLPSLAEENPQIATQLARLADDAREASAILRERTAAALLLSGRRAAAFKEESQLVRRYALKTLVEREAGRSLTRAHLTALDRMLWHGGQVRVPGDVMVSIDDAGEITLQRVTKRGRGLKRPTE